MTFSVLITFRAVTEALIVANSLPARLPSPDASANDKLRTLLLPIPELCRSSCELVSGTTVAE